MGLSRCFPAGPVSRRNLNWETSAGRVRTETCGGARGAAVGAVVGAIAGNAGKGAKIGAASGGLVGGMRSWSMTIDQTTGDMTVAIAGDDIGFVLFGVCTVP